MVRLPLKTLLILALMSGCHQTEASGTSKALQQDTIPQLVTWSKAGGEFDLAKALPVGSFDRLCVIPEYNCLDSNKVMGRLDAYHSDFGQCIPENMTALVLIGDRQAHAALVDGRRLRFTGFSSGECVAASRAMLRSNPEEHRRAQVAGLFER